MIYICTIRVELPKLSRRYQDGDYHRFIKSSSTPDSYELLAERIIQLKKDKIKYYYSVYDRNSCTTEYVSLSAADRSEIKDTLLKFLVDNNFKTSYTEDEYNDTVKEYIFLD